MLRIVCPKGELENHQVGCDGLLPFNHSLFPNPDSRFPTTNPPSPLRRQGPSAFVRNPGKSLGPGLRRDDSRKSPNPGFQQPNGWSSRIFSTATVNSPSPAGVPRGHKGEGWGEGGATRKRKVSSKPKLHPHPPLRVGLSRQRERRNSNDSRLSTAERLVISNFFPPQQ